MLRIGLGCVMLVMIAVAAMQTEAQAADRGRYCPCADRYSECMQQGKGAGYCEKQNQDCVWKECRR